MCTASNFLKKQKSMTKHDKSCVKQEIQTIWKRQQIKKKGEANDEDSCCCPAHLMMTRLELSVLTFRSHLFVSKGVHRRKKVTAWGAILTQYSIASQANLTCHGSLCRVPLKATLVHGCHNVLVRCNVSAPWFSAEECSIACVSFISFIPLNCLTSFRFYSLIQTHKGLHGLPRKATLVHGCHNVLIHPNYLCGLPRVSSCWQIGLKSWFTQALVLLFLCFSGHARSLQSQRSGKM
ncbi:uncharacterized protein LOC144122151 [Amblyomma americanum]